MLLGLSPTRTSRRKLTPAEQRYAALEQEALAIKELRFYLTGRRRSSKDINGVVYLASRGCWYQLRQSLTIWCT
ncbi:hypothetical protein MHYP_G00361670 [Metynnis hypsauchen]